MTEQQCFLIVCSTCFSSLAEDLKSIDIFMKCKNVSNEYMQCSNNDNTNMSFAVNCAGKSL